MKEPNMIKSFEERLSETAKKYVLISGQQLHEAVTQNMLNALAKAVNKQEKRIDRLEDFANDVGTMPEYQNRT